MSLAPWTLVDEAQVVRDRWIDLRRQRLRTPAGHTVDDYYVLHYPDWVTAVAVTPAGRFLRVRQWRPGARVESLEFAGGVAEPRETPEAAAARELLEETGHLGDPPVLLQTLWANPASHTNRVHTLLITAARRVQAPAVDPAETLEVEEATGATVLDDVRCGRMIHPLHVAAAFAVLLHRPALFEDAR